jgi:DNA-binding transcriptional ArsR family regulator
MPVIVPAREAWVAKYVTAWLHVCVNEVAAAVADPVRRDIVVMLRDQRLAAGQIAARFAISRPAVSRHLRLLRECGLVRSSLVGRQRFYELDASRFVELIEWLDQFTGAAGLERRLDALETEVYRIRRERRRSVAAVQAKENAG